MNRRDLLKGLIAIPASTALVQTAASRPDIIEIARDHDAAVQVIDDRGFVIGPEGIQSWDIQSRVDTKYFRDIGQVHPASTMGMRVANVTHEGGVTITITDKDTMYLVNRAIQGDLVRLKLTDPRRDIGMTECMARLTSVDTYATGANEDIVA